MGVVGVMDWVRMQVDGCCRCGGLDWDAGRWVFEVWWMDWVEVDGCCRCGVLDWDSGRWVLYVWWVGLIDRVDEPG